MKNPLLFFGILFGILLLTSCTIERDDTLLDADYLVQNSVWDYNNYEIIEISETNVSDLTRQEIKNAMNLMMDGVSYEFKRNETGITYYQELEYSNWQWQIERDKLITTGISPNNNIQRAIDFEVLLHTLYIYDTLSYGDIEHYGRLVFHTHTTPL